MAYYYPQDEFIMANFTYTNTGFDLSTPHITDEELFAFQSAHQNIYNHGNAMDMGFGCEGMRSGMVEGMGCWGQPEMKMDGTGYLDYSLGMDQMESNMYPCMTECGSLAGSCQASPFADPLQLLPQQQPASSFMDSSSSTASLSPVTPSGSPYPQAMHHGQPSYLLVPTNNNGQFQQFSAFQVTPDSFIGNITIPAQAPQPAFIASPMEDLPALETEEDGDEEEEEEENVLPNCGNTELRGMGLYDDTPDLLYDDSLSSPLFGSPITPHDQLRPTLGRGLVLERSFGLPEEMMMKDEVSGKIVKGKLRIDDEAPRVQPVIYGNEYQAYSVPMC